MTSRLEENQLQPGDIGTAPWANGIPVPVNGSSTFFVSQLDWRKPPMLQPVDVILAADVVYAHHLIPPLVSLLKELLSSAGGSEDKITGANVVKHNTHNNVKTNRNLLNNIGTIKNNITTANIQNSNTYSNNKANTTDFIAHRNQLRTRDTTMHKHKMNKTNTNENARRINNSTTTTSPIKNNNNINRSYLNATSTTLASSANTVNTAPHSKLKEAFIACTRRNQDTLNTFLTALNAESLQHQLVYQTNSETALFGYNESYMPVKVFRIRIKNPDG
ncbi:uncharacterized protein LOC143022080 [Oratosquilla oratoria]|uniref:uncharacterized protein LOC143022080 n=1 Tax=Oratosquilla oratoria TaxID=337810 RepID=UPI003F75B44A